MTETDKFVLLRGIEHNNVFWTPNSNIDESKFEILYYGNTSEEMVAEWEKYNRYALMDTCFESLRQFTNFN